MKAFTLVETLVAVAILALAITAPLYTASRAIVAAENSSYQLSASYLAQEGIEYIRWMRDNAYIDAYKNGDPTVSATAWNTFTTGPLANCTSPNICALDPTTYFAPTQCSDSDCTEENLYMYPNGAYTLSATDNSGNPNTTTPFIRTIQLTAISATDEQIVSRVRWFFHGTTYDVHITEHLTPWQ